MMEEVVWPLIFYSAAGVGMRMKMNFGANEKVT
jgi:hypothetical protein